VEAAMADEGTVEEAVVAEVVGDEDAAIFITAAKAIVKIAAVKVVKVAIEPIETTVAKSGVAIVKLGKTTAAACHLR
jgi:hypothetical protein